jgi:hypothetical protein
MASLTLSKERAERGRCLLAGVQGVVHGDCKCAINVNNEIVTSFLQYSLRPYLTANDPVDHSLGIFLSRLTLFLPTDISY